MSCQLNDTLCYDPTEVWLKQNQNNHSTHHRHHITDMYIHRY